MTRPIDEIRSKLTQPQLRSMSIERGLSYNDAERSVELAFASDKPVETWFGDLILSMGKKNVRTDRLEAGLALLLDHDRTKQIGIVDSFDFGADGVARATVRFSQSAEGSEIYQDVKDGIRRSVSVGFMVHELHLEKQNDAENDLYRSDDWEPIEISLVSIPADISVGVGRSLFEPTPPLQSTNSESPNPPADQRANPSNPENNMTPEEIAAAAEAAAQEQRSTAAATVTPAVAVRREIAELGTIFNQSELARTYAATDNASVDGFLAAVRAAQVPSTQIPPVPAAEQAKREGGVQLAKSLYRGGPLRSFKGEKAEERAYRSGMFILATIGRSAKAQEFCRENGIAIERAHSGDTNSLGGFLVPDEFDSSIIDLRIQYGSFRANANVVPMAGDTKTRPRRTGGLTAYFTGAGDAATESTKSWDTVTLVAKKVSVLAKYENELAEDAVINIADDLASEIAYAFSQKEDDCGFNGDGTSTYGGIVGIRQKLLGLSATRANIAGLQVASGNAWSEITIGDMQGLVGRLPQFARRSGGVKYYCSHEFWATVLQRLAQSVGGVTAAEVVNGIEYRFFGTPVEIVEVMPHSEANDDVCLLYGNISQAAMLGDRRGTSIAMTDSDSTDFAKAIMSIRGDTRFDINVHDVGNASGTPALRTPGPIVGLLTAAS